MTVIDEFFDLERELNSRGATVWFAAFTPAVHEVARQLPVWADIVAQERVYPTALAAVHAFRAR